MAVLKCKMCGGDLFINPGSRVGECDYCGAVQTIPDADDEKKASLFNRANRLRMAGEFDKASGIYETLVSDFPEEAESYWGRCLCRYGISYVDDPATGKKIPTCHRTLYDSILEDEDFQMVQAFAEPDSAKLYRREASQIDRIQKEILRIVQNEKPCDIFICYKERDEYDDRTSDSVYAQDIYNALTDKGYRVFFARITLEDKLGEEFEPYIFAALQSARLMLVVGTEAGHMNAVWVKNEWSRFLNIMRYEKDRSLITCLAGLDPAELPEELKNFQRLNMEEQGWLQELVRGIGKIVPVSEQTDVSDDLSRYDVKVEELLRKGDEALRGMDMETARDFYNEALDEEYECSEAWFGMFLVENMLLPETLSGDGNDSVYLDPGLLFDKNFENAVKYANDRTRYKLDEALNILLPDLAWKALYEYSGLCMGFYDIHKDGEEAEAVTTAKSYAGKVLSFDPENPLARLVLLLIEHKAYPETMLKEEFTGDPAYMETLTAIYADADDELRETMEDFFETAIALEKREYDTTLDSWISTIMGNSDLKALLPAKVAILNKLDGYRNSRELAAQFQDSLNRQSGVTPNELGGGAMKGLFGKLF